MWIVRIRYIDAEIRSPKSIGIDVTCIDRQGRFGEISQKKEPKTRRYS